MRADAILDLVAVHNEGAGENSLGSSDCRLLPFTFNGRDRERRCGTKGLDFKRTQRIRVVKAGGGRD